MLTFSMQVSVLLPVAYRQLGKIEVGPTDVFFFKFRILSKPFYKRLDNIFRCIPNMIIVWSK